MTQNVITDDSEFVEQALKEYRQATEDYSSFADLHREAQHVVLDRAQQLKDSRRELATWLPRSQAGRRFV